MGHSCEWDSFDSIPAGSVYDPRAVRLVTDVVWSGPCVIATEKVICVTDSDGLCVVV